MKKVIFILNFALILPVFLKAQNMDAIIENKAIAIANARPPLRDIMESCSQLYMQYMTESKLDSASYVLDYWEKEGGVSEPVFRAKVILNLYSNSFEENIFSENNIQHLYDFKDQQNRDRFYNHHLRSNTYYYSCLQPYYNERFHSSEFDLFSQSMANKIAPEYPDGSIENLISLFYGGDTETLFATLCNSEDYQESILKQEFKNEIKRINNMSEFNYALFSGAWIPTGKLNIVGTHPEIGFQFGSKYKKMNYDLTISLRFMRAANRYQYWDHDKNIQSTKHYFGGYIGFDVGRDIIVKGRHELQIIGGIAYDGIDVVNKDKDKNIKEISVGSINFNTGLGYRFYLSSGHYLGIRAKYNFLNYARNKHFDYKGDAMSIHLVWGGLFSPFKKEGLDYFKQKFRN